MVMEACSRLGTSSDAAAFEDLLMQMATAYSHIPEVRIDWLKRLAEHHRKVCCVFCFSAFVQSLYGCC